MQSFGSRRQSSIASILRVLGGCGCGCAAHAGGPTDWGQCMSIVINTAKLMPPKWNTFIFIAVPHCPRHRMLWIHSLTCEYMFTVYANSMRHSSWGPSGPCTVYSGLRLTRTHSNCLLLSRGAAVPISVSQVHCTHYDTILSDIYSRSVQHNF